MKKARRGAPLLGAAAATLAALEWPALLHTGDRCRVPPELEPEQM